jgi:histidine triad (HIT) family protein
MNDCLFCKIIAGEVPSYKVYEDSYAYACLNIYPKTKGHTLVVPKKHYTCFTDMSEEYVQDFMRSMHKIAKIVKEYGEGLNILQNEGTVSGQTIFHSHFHLIPRREQDGVVILDSDNLDKVDFDAILADLKSLLKA